MYTVNEIRHLPTALIMLTTHYLRKIEMMIRRDILIIVLTILSAQVFSQTKPNSDLAKKDIGARINLQFNQYKSDALALWNLAELGYKEYESSKVISGRLAEQGFRIDSVNGMPTAFVASYGSGKPVISFLAEYDALPGF